MPSEQEYDVIVVGAGSAGSALASRLSDASGRSILLLEAGASYDRLEDFPPEIVDPAKTGAAMPGHPANWSMTGTFFPGRTYSIPRGKVIGGSSSINGAYFVRGLPDNFARWADEGHDRWSYEQVLPFFKATETDLDFDTDVHGRAGPIPVRRQTMDRAPEFMAAFREACHEMGFPDEPDKNGGGNHGVGPVPMNIADNIRVSTAIGYLLPRMGRPGFTVQGDTFVRRVLFEDARVVGVEADVRGERTTLRAGEVVVAAGALRTPHVLMLSGVGPADHLREFGLPVVADLAGVGQNLVDHPELVATYKIDVEIPDIPGRGAFGDALHWTAEGSRHPSDLEIFPALKSLREMTNAVSTMWRHPIRTLRGLRGTSLRAVASTASFGDHTGFAVLGLQQEDSRGQVRLVSSNPADHPSVDYNFLAEAEDRRRMREVAATFAGIFKTKAMASIKGGVPDLKPSDLADARALDEWVRSKLQVAGHPSSTCRMGPSSDPAAVVDQHGLVHGVEGLRIADTSIWPMAVSRGPNASAIMTGERIAALMLEEHADAARAGQLSQSP